MALALLGSQLALSAAATVVKKAYEQSVAAALRQLGGTISERFQGNKELLALKDELGLKLRMLALPVDVAAHHATRGHTALQEALDAALGVLNDINAFEEALTREDIAQAQGEALSPPDAAATARRMRALIARLDALLPYLSLAISAVGDIHCIEWATTQSLGHGELEFQPALVLYVSGSPAGGAGAGGDAAGRPPPGLGTPQGAPGLRRFAVQCSGPAGGGAGGVGASGPASDAGSECEAEEGSGSSGSQDADEEEEEGRNDGGSGSQALTEQWRVLGQLEYLLRLCVLENLEGRPHHTLTDERIRMAFLAPGPPGAPGGAGGGAGALRAHARGGGSAAAWTPPSTAAGATPAGVDEVTTGIKRLNFASTDKAAARKERPFGSPIPESSLQRLRRKLLVREAENMQNHVEELQAQLLALGRQARDPRLTQAERDALIAQILDVLDELEKAQSRLNLRQGAALRGGGTSSDGAGSSSSSDGAGSSSSMGGDESFGVRRDLQEQMQPEEEGAMGAEGEKLGARGAARKEEEGEEGLGAVGAAEEDAPALGAVGAAEAAAGWPEPPEGHDDHASPAEQMLALGPQGALAEQLAQSNGGRDAGYGRRAACSAGDHRHGKHWRERQGVERTAGTLVPPGACCAPRLDGQLWYW
eukprot:scaffold8.g1669.t1